MLALSRKEHEQIVIGKAGDNLTEPIVISIGSIKDNRVILGVIAQRNVNIAREEIDQMSASERRERVQSGKGGE